MEANDVKHLEKFKFSLRYPWLSLLLSLLLVLYTALLFEPSLQTHLDPLPLALFSYRYLQGFWLLWLVVMWLEYRHFRGQVRLLKQQLQKLWNHKQQLQQRAHTSAGHTDKLKMFISDKLLEYIEYDEKYLHFKSIAKEVRHNGVISFDKVQQALYLAQQQHPEQAEYPLAQASMRYLWDLLDLSTADNMAMHIANQISQQEELVYQAELNNTRLSDLPLTPTFSVQRALIDTLTVHLGCTLQPSPQQANILISVPDGLFEVQLAACSDLLGNANHLILLLENLLKNAQFFATQKRYKSPFPPIIIYLTERQNCVHISIYNRGPHIADTDRAQIFKLGFSTRRAQGHHGKGLGLYFAQQIVQGFDGHIDVNNIDNDDDELYLRLEYQHGEVQQLALSQQLQNGEVVLCAPDEPVAAAISIAVPSALKSIEISSKRYPRVQRFDPTALTSWRVLGDLCPRWQLHYQAQQKKLQVQVLDVRGVEFQLKLPTLKGRQEGVSAVALTAPNVDDLHAQFQHPDDF